MQTHLRQAVRAAVLTLVSLGFAALTFAQTPAVLTPPPGSSITSYGVTFTWSAGGGVSEYRLKVGTSLGGGQIYDASQGTNLTGTIFGVPASGTLYVRLAYLSSGTWRSVDSTYIAASTGAGPQMTAPTPGSRLSASSVLFSWTAGSGVAEFRLKVGTTLGGNQIYDASQGLGRSRLVGRIPTNGTTVYVRLAYLLGGTWQSRDYTYLAALAGARPEIASPVPGSTLTSHSVTFTWTSAPSVTEHRLKVGNTLGGTQYYDKPHGTALSATVTNMPTDGSPVYVRLAAFQSGAWVSTDYLYTAATYAIPDITSPSPGSTLPPTRATFAWSAGTAVTEYRLKVGTSPGGTDIHDASAGLTRTAAVVGLPPGGRQIYVRLAWVVGGVWKSRDCEFKSAAFAIPLLQQPTAGSTLPQTTATFVWSPGTGVQEYRLKVGTTLGGSQVLDSPLGLVTSRTVSGLPDNGGPLYVRLAYLLGGTWGSDDYTFTMASSRTDPRITSPVPGSTLTATSAAFAWTAGGGAAEYRLKLGTTLGGGQIYDVSQGTSLSRTVSGLPANGSQVFARLAYRVGTTWYSRDYVYKATGSPPRLSIADATVYEGDSGTTAATFTVSLSTPDTQPILVGYATANSTAASGSDYVAASGTLTFAPSTTTQTISVLVNGDRAPELDEVFFVNLSGATGATFADAQAVGRILNDDSSLPRTPRPLRPSGTVADATPEFAWDALADASQYELLVTRSSGGVVLRQAVDPAAACSAGVCAFVPAQDLAAGSHEWRVRASNAVGTGPYSPALRFDVDVSPLSGIRIESHTSGQSVPLHGFVVSGRVEDPGTVLTLAASVDDPVLGRTVAGRSLDVSASGRWALWVRPGQVASGATVTVSLEVTRSSGGSSSVAMPLFVDAAAGLAESHSANRLSFGLTPELLFHLRAIGADAFRDEQLAPLVLDETGLESLLASMPLTTKAELQSRAIARFLFARRQLLEVLAQFWDNHFNTDINKPTTVAHEASENSLFRLHALGRFRDLLEVSATSPAMLVYLDNATSLKELPNENYARELLELHTLGVDGGYTQNDVENVARAFTGWTVRDGAFYFSAADHDTGAKSVLGEAIPAGRGIEDGRQVLDLLARHPSTARFVCRKLASLLVEDRPEGALVDACASAFQTSDGDVAEVVRFLLASADYSGASSYRNKVKTPLEFVAGTVRNLAATTRYDDLRDALTTMGMRLFENPVPTGYSETADDWVSSNALLERLRFVNRIARANATDPTFADVKGLVRAAGYETAEGVAGFLFELALQGDASPLDQEVALEILSPPGQAAFDIDGAEAEARIARFVGAVLSYPAYQMQ